MIKCNFLNHKCYERSRIITVNSKMEIYVGNLPWSTSDQDLADAFGAFGKVEKASIISDRNSGRSKGFGFVTMKTEEGVKRAVEIMNGRELDGRPVPVNQSTSKSNGKDKGGQRLPMTAQLREPEHWCQTQVSPRPLQSR